MTDLSWIKPEALSKPKTSSRAKFAMIGLILMGGMIAMLLGGTIAGGRFFITVAEVVNRADLAGKNVKLTGAVIGDSIRFDADSKTIHFTIAHITDDFGEIEAAGGIAALLNRAVNDPSAQRLAIVVENQPMPDLLQNEAQAILSGKLGEDGIFYADELQLKCPSKYESEVPEQATG